MVCPLLRGRSPTRSVAPKPLRGLGRASLRLPSARGCRRIWRGVVSDLLVSPARCCSTGSGRLLRGPALTSFVTLTRARGPGRGLPVVTGSLANEIGRAKTAEGSRACFSPASLGAWVPKNLARRSLDLLVSPARCCSTGSGRLLRGPRFNLLCHPYTRARARPWSARCYGVARQRDRSRQNSTGVSGVLLSGFPRRVGAEESGAA